jgi:ribonuclease VapC
MFVDAAAIVAVLTREPEAERCSDALGAAAEPITSAIAVWEAAVALARPDKFGVSVGVAQTIVLEFLASQRVAVRDLPPAAIAATLALDAAQRYCTGKQRLNLADCFHYACARFYGVPILSTGGEFESTDLATVP